MLQTVDHVRAGAGQLREIPIPPDAAVSVSTAVSSPALPRTFLMLLTPPDPPPEILLAELAGILPYALLLAFTATPVARADIPREIFPCRPCHSVLSTCSWPGWFSPMIVSSTKPLASWAKY